MIFDSKTFPNGSSAHVQVLTYGRGRLSAMKPGQIDSYYDEW
jgi:hypothetical protein